MDVLIGPDGIRVRQVELRSWALVYARMFGDDSPGVSRLLITRRGVFVAMVRDAEGLAEHVDLADLRPA
jgi:hypothetical protein